MELSAPSVVIEFTEPEARLLSEVVFRWIVGQGRVEGPQAAVLASVCEKFGRAAQEQIDRLIEKHGSREAAEAAAREYIAAHPEGDLPGSAA